MVYNRFCKLLSILCNNHSTILEYVVDLSKLNVVDPCGHINCIDEKLYKKYSYISSKILY